MREKSEGDRLPTVHRVEGFEMAVNEDDYEREVKCDGEGCDRYYFITHSCGLTDKQLDAIGAILGWIVNDEVAYCPHCKPPKPKAKPLTKKERELREKMGRP